MTKLKVPGDGDGLQELLGDPGRLKEYFSAAAVQDGTTKEFLDAYSKQYVKNNAGTQDDLRTQVQSVMFDMMREQGAGKRAAADVNRVLSFTDGRPQLQLGAGGTAAIARGRGTVYNKYSAGAALERQIPEADRFGTIGEYCQAIRYRNTALTGRDRDELVRKLDLVSGFQNSFGSEDPGAGGYLIPEIMRSELLQLATEDSVVRSRATVIPMSTAKVPIPTVDDTSHVSSLFGGVIFYWAEESSSIPESQATFGKVSLDAKKLAGLFKVPNELLADAPAFSAFFDTSVPRALAFQEDQSFMTGTGVGQPLGYVNCPASVSVAKESGQATGTILWENIAGMYARMLPTSLKNAVWIASIDTFKELATMALSVGTGGGPIWMGSMGQSGADTPPMTILGRPVIFTEKAPALSTTGDISFVDLSYYLIGDRQAVAVSASEHAAFANDQTTYKIIERVDGRPWLQSALTPANGSSSTLSPFVQIATR